MNVSYSRLLSSLSLPVTMTVLVPACILWTSSAGAHSQPSSLIFGLGCLFILAGLLLLVLTIQEFITVGKGTLAPWDPPKELVVTGMYRYTRNPMLSGVLAMILGEAFVFDSLGIFYWLLLFFVFNTIYFTFSEERKLTKKFDDKYLEYKANVPRWVPRLSPWKSENNK